MFTNDCDFQLKQLAGQLEKMEKPTVREASSDILPEYWDLLSETDKLDYQSLKVTFNADSFRRNRGHRIETFDGILDTIRRYAEKGDDDDWKRFLVCGVCWMDRAIAINTRQMRILIAKCKSSINGSLQKMGYSTNTSHSESWKILFSRIPLLKDNFTEIRQWTIRYKIQPQITMDGAIPMMRLPPLPMQMMMHPQIQRTQSGPVIHPITIPPPQLVIQPVAIPDQRMISQCPLKVRAKLIAAEEQTQKQGY